MDKVKKKREKEKEKKKAHFEKGLSVCCHRQGIMHLEQGTPPRCVIWDQVSPFCDLEVVQS